LVDPGRSKEQERRKKNTNPNLKGDISLLEIPRKNVGTATRLGILEETIRKRKRRIRRKIIIFEKHARKDGGDVFVAVLATHVGQSVWLIDPRASFHTTSHWHYVLVYEKYDGGMTYLCDNSPLKIVSCGRVVIRFHDCRVKGIDEVLHILGLAQTY
jgi:hypothetical protein